MADKETRQRQGRQGRARREGRQVAGGSGPRREGRGCKGQGCRQEGGRVGREEAARAGGEGDAAAAHAFRRGHPQGADRAVRLQESDAGAARRQDRAQHGHRRGRRRPQEGRAGRRGDWRRSPARRPVITKSRKSIATYKLRDGQADRLQGHAAQGAHVRVPRPPGEHRAAARARLPRAQSEELRRPRQLFARHQGAHRFSRRSTTTRLSDIWGMDITVCTTARNDDEARALLTAFNSRSGSEGLSALKRG